MNKNTRVTRKVLIETKKMLIEEEWKIQIQNQPKNYFNQKLQNKGEKLC
jgi:hypothetical protein